MSPAAFEKTCLALAGATVNLQWGEDYVYKVGGRMFAVATPTGGCSLKTSDIAFEALTESGRARPAPYLARAKWVLFDDIGVLDDAEMVDWLKSAHDLVAAKLTRAQRRELGL